MKDKIKTYTLRFDDLRLKENAIRCAKEQRLSLNSFILFAIDEKIKNS